MLAGYRCKVFSYVCVNDMYLEYSKLDGQSISVVMKRCLVEVLLIVFVLMVLPVCGQAQSARTWVSTKGTSIEAVLVKWSNIDVTLKKASGKEIVVPLGMLGAEEHDYLVGFSNLKEKKKPEKMPWVEVSAVVKSRGKDTRYNIYGTRFDNRKIKMMVNVYNHSNEKLDVDVIWMFFAGGVSSRMKLKSLEDYYPFNVEKTKITLEGKNEISFETAEARKTAVGYGQKYKSGSKIKGFVVQVYWEGWLLGGFASQHILKKIAEDEGLYKAMSGSAAR